MTSDVLLTAGIGEVLGFLVPIIFFVIYALNQVLSAKGKPQQQQPGRGQQRRAPQPRPERAPQRTERPLRPAQPQGGGAAQLNSEIEQFLKRASQRRPERSTAARRARAGTGPGAAQSPTATRTARRRGAPGTT